MSLIFVAVRQWRNGAIFDTMELYKYLSSAGVGDMLGYLRNEICTMHMFLQENMTMLKQNSLNHMQKWWYLDCFINKWPSNLLRLDYVACNDHSSSIVKYHQIWRSFIHETIKISSFFHVILHFCFSIAIFFCKNKCIVHVSLRRYPNISRSKSEDRYS